LALCECGKCTSDAKKVWDDNDKLVREGKDVLDRLYGVLGNKKQNSLSVWTFQFIGLNRRISSIHLAENGLYVAIPQLEFKFPHNLDNLSTFIDAYSSLKTILVREIK
jgi:hypothetical protein